MRSLRATKLASIAAIAVVHGIIYTNVLGAAIAHSESAPRQPVPLVATIAVLALGFPLMPLFNMVPAAWLPAVRAVMGNDTNSLFLAIGLNSLLWGSCIFLVWQGVRRRVGPTVAKVQR
jgi:hypothetical protein